MKTEKLIYENFIDKQFILLHDTTEPANPEFIYWTYPPFDFEKLSDEECNAELRFSKNNTYSLVHALRIPNKVICPNKPFIDAVEALHALLKRNSYPCRFSDLIPTFGRSVTELCNIASVTNNHIFETYGHSLANLNQAWLSAHRLQEFADAVYHKGALLSNCWGFIDGTRPIC